MACVAAVAGSSTLAAAVCCSSSSVSRSSASHSTVAFRTSFHNGVLRSDGGRTGFMRFQPLLVRAASSDETSADVSKQAEELYADIKAKWDGVENKATVAIYVGGALVTLWLSSTIVGAINSVPLLPKLMELIGLGYTGWFVYRYLLFKSSRKELVSDIEELKGKITGAAKDVGGE